MKQMNQTLRELFIGIVISGLIIGILGVLIVDNKVRFLLGLILGCAVAFMLAFHLYATIQKSVDMEERPAMRYTRFMALLRLFVMGVAIVLALSFPKVFNLVAVILGILCLKFSAFLQPLTNKYISNKRWNKGR